MKFGPTPLAESLGCILAHGISWPEGVFKKGRVLSAADLELLEAAGFISVIAVKLGADDVPEDLAAHKVAVAAAGRGAKAQAAFTGRANLHSALHGVLVVDEQRLRALNHLHESLTVATLPAYSVVTPKQMLATVKVIPFATPRKVLDQALALIGDQPLVRVAAFQNKAVGLVITALPQTKPSIIAKSEASIRQRVETKSSQLREVLVVPHEMKAVTDAVAALKTIACDPILVFGATAIVDRADIIPQSLVDSGGTVLHLGMPVDPGNLLMWGKLGATSVIGVPSCARSPKVNGFDWVLERVLAGLDVSSHDLMDMGTGGLLAEIPSRPQPREKQSALHAPRVSAVVLAAGTSSRMGSNKMLVDFKAEPMLRATVKNILQSSVDEVVVVTGHQREKVEAVLKGLNLRFVHNPDYADGLATSLRAGIASLQSDAAVVCLGDMPLVSAKLIDRLIAGFNPTEHRNLVVPTFEGQIGNPVLWGAEHFSNLMKLEGDRGARALLDVYKDERVEIDAGDSSVLRDADTPEALVELRKH